jgi:predicted nucleic acid-binding protein
LSPPIQSFQPFEFPFVAALPAGPKAGHSKHHDNRKRSPPPDFVVGAHAAVAGYRLMTRDAVRYRAISPSSH